MKWLQALLLLLCLSACGGGNQAPAPQQAPRQLATVVVTDYRTVVQQLYIAYFGRPADVGGLANFQAQLLALNAPTDIQLLDAAYTNSLGVRLLIESFSSSGEAAALYPSTSTTAFITSIYTNVLGRAPDAAGLAYWALEVESGRLTRAKASFSIMAGALTNSSAQGVADGKLVSNKVTIGSNFTIAVAAGAVDGYAGDAAAARARTMLATVTSTTDPVVFQTTVTALAKSLACDPYSAPPGVGSQPSC